MERASRRESCCWKSIVGMHVLLGVLSVSHVAGTARAAEPKAKFPGASEYLRGCNGHALLVYHRGALIYEAYFNGHTAEKAHRLASGTKSFWGPLAVAAQEDGLLSLDEKVADTLTEWKSDPQKSQITIRQLLSLSSGIAGGIGQRPPPYAEAVKAAKSVGDPGTVFRYGPVPFQCFGELLRRKLEPRRETVKHYLHRRLLDPIGLKVEFWRHERGVEGNLHIPSGAFLTAREWAKWGLFLLHEGRSNGRQLIPAEKLRACFLRSAANPIYGMTFWLAPKQSSALPRDLIQAAGKGKQKLYIVPSMDLLVVQFAEASRRDYSEAVFFRKLMADCKALGITRHVAAD